MKRFSLLTLCCLATLSAQAANDPISPTNFDLPAIDAYVTREVKDLGIEGASLAIVRDGQLVFAKGYGRRSLEKQEPVTTNTLFAIGSITKQFTCACILLLAEDGKLSVEDKLEIHLAILPAAWTNVTLRHLKTHTSGIKSYTGLDGFALTKYLTQPQFIETIGKRSWNFNRENPGNIRTPATVSWVMSSKTSAAEVTGSLCGSAFLGRWG